MYELICVNNENLIGNIWTAVVGLMTSIVPELNKVKNSGNVAQKKQVSPT